MKLSRILLTVVVLCVAMPAFGQSIGFERGRHKTMLDIIKSDVKKNYFDPEFKKIDIELKYKEALENLKNANSVGQMSSALAQFLAEFDDSHLFYLPPGKSNTIDYGIEFRMAGDKCLVVQIDKGSDAEKKGLQVGDELRSISSFGPTRETLWKIRYFFFVLFPQPELNLAVIKPDGSAAAYTITPKVTTGTRIAQFDINQIIRDSVKNRSRATRQYYYDKFEGAFIWKMPSFSLQPQNVDSMMGRAKKFPAIVFDLRGNGGGRVDMLLRLVGNVFDRNIKVGDEKKRSGSKELIAKTRGNDAYKGKIVVLVDSDSGSASEVFAKIIQLENRGTIFGERSAGAVMESRFFPHQLGDGIVMVFGASITIADLIMTDGKSLEKIGVTPDITLVPTPQDLASKRDVVLAKSLQSLGIEVTPEVAAAIFANVADEQ